MTPCTDEDLARAIDPGAFSSGNNPLELDRTMTQRRAIALGAAMRVQIVLRAAADGPRRRCAGCKTPASGAPSFNIRHHPTTDGDGRRTGDQWPPV